MGKHIADFEVHTAHQSASALHMNAYAISFTLITYFLATAVAHASASLVGDKSTGFISGFSPLYKPNATVYFFHNDRNYKRRP